MSTSIFPIFYSTKVSVKYDNSFYSKEIKSFKKSVGMPQIATSFYKFLYCKHLNCLFRLFISFGGVRPSRPFVFYACVCLRLRAILRVYCACACVSVCVCVPLSRFLVTGPLLPRPTRPIFTRQPALEAPLCPRDKIFPYGGRS